MNAITARYTISESIDIHVIMNGYTCKQLPINNQAGCKTINILQL